MLLKLAEKVLHMCMYCICIGVTVITKIGSATTWERLLMTQNVPLNLTTEYVPTPKDVRP